MMVPHLRARTGSQTGFTGLPRPGGCEPDYGTESDGFADWEHRPEPAPSASVRGRFGSGEEPSCARRPDGALSQSQWLVRTGARMPWAAVGLKVNIHVLRRPEWHPRVAAEKTSERIEGAAVVLAGGGEVAAHDWRIGSRRSDQSAMAVLRELFVGASRL